MLTEKAKAPRAARRGRGGETLRPGAETPLWNALVAQVRPLLKGHGEQAKLARLLGLHRQSIHAYFSAVNRMPDAERTLQLLAWLVAQRQGRPPS
jgi:ribosomal protein L30/L7E